MLLLWFFTKVRPHQTHDVRMLVSGDTIWYQDNGQNEGKIRSTYVGISQQVRYTKFHITVVQALPYLSHRIQFSLNLWLNQTGPRNN